MKQGWGQRLSALVAGRSLVLGMLTGLFLGSGPAQAADSVPVQVDLGGAAQYSALIFGNVSKLNYVDGRLAVGGNLNLEVTSPVLIGAKLPANDSSAVLLVGGDIPAFTFGFLRSMDGSKAGWGEYLGNKGSKFYTRMDLRKVSYSRLDFAAERTYLSVLSQQLHQLPASGTVQQNGSEVQLQGTQAELELFVLNAAQIRSGMKLSLQNIRPDAWIVLPVDADAQHKLSFGLDTSALNGRAQRVLYNLHDTDVLSIVSNLRVQGNLLAPLACIKDGRGGHWEGSVVAASWDSEIGIGLAALESSR